MNRYTKYALIVGAVAILCLGSVTAMSAHEDDEDEVVTKGKVKIVMVDDDGEDHENVWVHDDKHKRAFLGVQVESVESGGARIGKVVGDSAAERAGLQDGDVIVSFNGETVDGPVDLTRAIRGIDPGQNVTVEVLRDGQPQTLTAEMGEYPGHRTVWFGGDDNEFAFEFDEQQWQEKMEELHERLEGLELHLPDFKGNYHFSWTQRPLLGVQIVQTTPELRQHLGGSDDAGVLVGKVMEGMPAEEGGVRVGDLIVAVDGEAVSDAGDLRHALAEKAGSTITIDVVRDGRSMALSVFIPEPEVEKLDSDGNAFLYSDPEHIEGLVREALEAAQIGREEAALATKEARMALREAQLIEREEVQRAVKEARAAAHEATLVQREEMHRAMEEARRAYTEAVKQAKEDAEWY